VRGALLMLLCGAAAAVSAAGCNRAAASPATDPASVERAFGVRAETVRRSAGGYMLDFRFRVLDEAKAQPLFDRDSRPYLLHHRTGARLFVPKSPKIGSMRARRGGASAPLSFVIFANPGRLVEPGDEVTAVVGSFRSPRLVVQ
jgi:hypothetical protein